MSLNYEPSSQSACRSIADMVGKAGIQDMTGFAGTGENIQGEKHTLPVLKSKHDSSGTLQYRFNWSEDGPLDQARNQQRVPVCAP